MSGLGRRIAGFPSVGAFVRGFTDVMEDRRAPLAGALAAVTLIAFHDSRARRRAAGYRYWRKRARKERLGFGVPLVSAGGRRLFNRPED